MNDFDKQYKMMTRILWTMFAIVTALITASIVGMIYIAVTTDIKTAAKKAGELVSIFQDASQ